jgi:uncharacterized iron-regulated membrane protein
MRIVHRWIAVVILGFALWFSITGIAIQGIDLAAILSHAPATNPNMLAIHESIDGPPNQIVIRPQDYAAQSFPVQSDYARLFVTLARTARADLGQSAPLAYLDIRAGAGQTIGEVRSAEAVVRYALPGGQKLPSLPNGQQGPQSSAHDTAKHLHRLFFLGDDMLWLNALVGIGLGAMIVTGIVMYFRLLKMRARLKRRNPFWSAGGRWRSLHRSVSAVAAVFLLVVAVTGTLLSIDSLSFGLYRAFYPDRLVHGFSPVGTVGDFSTPLREGEIDPMLATTLAAYRAHAGDRPIKAIRLRYFAGHPQGIVIAGGEVTEQLIFNARSGATEGLSGAGYPYTGFPTGWQLHELLKKIHRGDIIGVPGRVIDLLSGLSLAFLSISGLALYLDLKGRRSKAGRKGFFWR